MEIFGTKRDKFTILIDFAGYKKGEIIEPYYGEGKMEVIEALDINKGIEYIVAYPALVEEELEISLSHFKFLKKYNLV